MSNFTTSVKHLQRSDISRIVDSIVACVENAKLETEPYEHFRMVNVFPADVYNIMLSSFPERNAYHDLKHKDARLPDGTSTRKRFAFDEEHFAKVDPELAGTWEVIGDALCDAQVKNAMFSKLRASIETRIRENSGELWVKGEKWENVEAYPRPALYRDESGYKITPHPDSPLKVVTVQIYLPADHSQRLLGTSVYRRKKWHEHLLNPFASPFTQVKQFDFVPNSGYAFTVTENSFHGREAISAADGLRQSILLLYLRNPVKLAY